MLNTRRLVFSLLIYNQEGLGWTLLVSWHLIVITLEVSASMTPKEKAHALDFQGKEQERALAGAEHGINSGGAHKL